MLFKIIIGIVIGIYIISIWPKTYNKTFDGIKYRLRSNEEFEEVTIVFDGKLTRNFILGNKFVGTLKIGNIDIPSKKSESEQITLDFNKNNWTTIDEAIWTNEEPKLISYGEIYFDKKFEHFTIAWKEKDGDGYTWNSGTGLMITAPVKGREEAIKLSNQLMKSRLFHNGKYLWLK
jgi:hypothetical protein